MALHRSPRTPVLALAVGALMLSACGADLDVSFGGEDGEGAVETRTIEVSNFDAIELDSFLSAVVVVDPTSEPTLTLTTNPNLFDNFSADVDGSTLAVAMDDVSNADENLVTITVPTLERFAASGATSAELSGIDSSLVLDVSGASDVVITAAEGVEVPMIDVEASGASSADLSELPAATASVEIGGSSSVEVNVSGTVIGTVDGASSLDVDGGAQIEATASGAASIDSE